MILARLDAWFTVFIILVWAVSAFLEFQRKKKLKEQKRQQQSGQTRREQGFRPDGLGEQASQREAEREAQLLAREREILEEAERQVRHQEYQAVPTGRDLQVNLEDLLKRIGASDSLPDDEIIHDDEFVPPVRAPLIPIQSSAPGSNISAPTAEVEQREARMDYFAAGLPDAIIAAEILGRPKALRGRRRLV